MGVRFESSAPVTTAPSVTITTANLPQQLFGDVKRNYLLVQNNSDTDMWLGIGATPSVGSGIKLAAGGGAYVAEDDFIPSGPVSIICASAGKAFYAIQG
jgi:hypothetical protein